MRLWVGFLVTLLVYVVATGCAPKDKQDGYAVLFDGQIHLYDDGVYYTGNQVGSIQSKQAGEGGITRLTIALSPDFVADTGNNLALYVHAGRLEVAKLQTLGQVLEKDALLCGFVSKSELTWFKIKTLLNDRIKAAQIRAAALQARLG